jgi:hypothetical protein
MSSLRFWRNTLLIMAWAAALLVWAGGASGQGHRDGGLDHARDVHGRHSDHLSALPDVEGSAVGMDDEGGPVIHVFTDRHDGARIPKAIEGVSVQPMVTGKFYALAFGRPSRTPVNRWYYARAVPIGVSTGNEGEASAGTIGCRVTDGTNVYALSNNHVYALEGRAPLGSQVLQPGLYDMPFNQNNVIGRLSAFAQIDFSATAENRIDAALAVSGTTFLGNGTPSGGYGIPRADTLDAAVRQPVMKYGRTTKQTTGRVYAINATIKVTYTAGVARFVNQIIITPGSFSAAGDSGSLVVYGGRDGNYGKPIGLLFAGSSSLTVANPIDEVLDHFGVTIDGL